MNSGGWPAVLHTVVLVILLAAFVAERSLHVLGSPRAVRGGHVGTAGPTGPSFAVALKRLSS